MTTTTAVHKLSETTSRLFDRGQGLWKPIGHTLTLSLAEGLLVPIKAVSVSIERDSISVAAGSRFLSRIKVNGSARYSTEDGKYPSPDNFATTVSLGMTDLGVWRPAVILSIPRDWAVVRFASLPSTVKENLAAVVGYELDRLTPFSPESAYYDFRLVGEEDGRLNVMVVAARADLVDQYVQALKKEDIGVERLTVNVSSLATLCSYAFEAAPSICVEVGSLCYEGCCVQSNMLSSSFSGTFGTDDEASKIDTIVDALEPVIASTRSAGILPSVVLASRENIDAEVLKRRLKIPVRRTGESGLLRRLSPDEGEVPCGAWGALLESLWPKANSLNLFEKGVPGKTKTPVAISVILAILFLALWIPYVVLPLQREEARLAEIERQVSIRKEEVRKVEYLKKDIKDLSAETATIDQFKGGRPSALAILKELTDILPQSAWTTRTRIGETGVDIEGYAKSASGLLSVLERSKYLKRAEFASPTIRDQRLDADRFVIKTAIAGSEKVEGEGLGNGKKK